MMMMVMMMMMIMVMMMMMKMNMMKMMKMMTMMKMMKMMMMMMMMMRRLSSLWVGAKPRHLPYIYKYVHREGIIMYINVCIYIYIYTLLYTYSITTRWSLHADPSTPPRCTPVDPGDHEALEMDGSQVVINMLHYRYAPQVQVLQYIHFHRVSLGLIWDCFQWVFHVFSILKDVCKK